MRKPCPALAAGVSSVPDRGAFRVVIGTEEFESLPPEVRTQLLHRSEELRRMGHQVEVTDQEGRPLRPGGLLPVA